MTSPASSFQIAVEVGRAGARTAPCPVRRSQVTVDELQELDRQMALLADGDRSAIEPLFRTLWPVIHAYCKRVLGAGVDAEDAA